MVADTVEIISSSIDDPSARQISLRSVHGKYLIRLLDKESVPVAARIGEQAQGSFAVCIGDISLNGLDDFCGLQAHYELLFLLTQPVGKFLSVLAQENSLKKCYLYASVAIQYTDLPSELGNDDYNYLEKDILQQSERLDTPLSEISDFMESVRLSKMAVFDPHARSGRQIESSIVI
jgi:hypothetical protein